MRHVVVADSTVAGYAIATDHGNDRCLGATVVGGGHGEKQASGCIVAGVAGVMYLVITGAQRDAGSCTGCGRMAARAFRR